MSDAGSPPKRTPLAVRRERSKQTIARLASAGAKDGRVFPIKFVSWRNTKTPDQPEHMTIKFGTDNRGEGTARYHDFRMGSGKLADPPPALEGVHNVLQSAAQAPKPQPFSPLAYGEHTPSEHSARFLARPSPPSQREARPLRYDSKEYMRVMVSREEREMLEKATQERQRTGVFHLFGEAREKDSKYGHQATRCMTFIELLAEHRKVKLDNGQPSAMAHQFHDVFSETTSRPKLNTYAGRDSNVPERTRTHTVSRLDERYWGEHDKGAHNVGKYKTL